MRNRENNVLSELTYILKPKQATMKMKLWQNVSHSVCIPAKKTVSLKTWKSVVTEISYGIAEDTLWKKYSSWANNKVLGLEKATWSGGMWGAATCCDSHSPLSSHRTAHRMWKQKGVGNCQQGEMPLFVAASCWDSPRSGHLYCHDDFGLLFHGLTCSLKGNEYR